MTHKSHFSSQRSALILGAGLFASLTFAGVTFAQSLNIPTNLSNAFITIKNIIVSPSGVIQDKNSADARIVLDSDGNIITKSNAGLGGNLTVGGEVRLKHNDFISGAGCNTATGCILRVTTDGKVAVTNNINPWLGQDEQASVFRRTSASQPNNIFLATSDGSNAVVGNQASQSYLRVGTTQDPNIPPEKKDAAIIAAGSIEARGGLLIRKVNNDNILGNEGDNLKTKLTQNYTDLDIGVKEQRINFTASYKFGNWFERPAIVFQSKSNVKPVSVGINVPDGSGVNAELHVANNGSMLVGTPSVGGEETSLFVNGLNDTVGIKTMNAQKTLDVNGTAAITQSLIVGHPSSFNPGVDKLSVNGSTRANAYYYNSDRRYKSDIEVLKSPLENLLKLSGYSYYNKLSGKKDLGVIAQEVETVYPDLVQTDADGYKSVEYGNLVAPIIEAIKELSNKVDTLFKTYLSQQAKIDSLEARLQLLESKIK